MIVELSPLCCSNRNSGLYPLNQGHMTKLPLSVNKWFYRPFPPTPPPPHTHTHTTYTHTLPATSKLGAHVL